MVAARKQQRCGARRHGANARDISESPSLEEKAMVTSTGEHFPGGLIYHICCGFSRNRFPTIFRENRQEPENSSFRRSGHTDRLALEGRQKRRGTEM